MGKFARKLLNGDEYQTYLKGGLLETDGRPYLQSPHLASHRISMFYADLHPMNLLRATRGARNPNLRQLLRMCRMFVASICLSFH